MVVIGGAIHYDDAVTASDGGGAPLRIEHEMRIPTGASPLAMAT
jgi:hypothetical protein